jgi:putative addiction module component (TIGR02574 family)
MPQGAPFLGPPAMPLCMSDQNRAGVDSAIVSSETQKMVSRPLRDEILSLPSETRLRLLEELWDSLEDPRVVPVPDWHRETLESRLSDPSEQLSESWDELKQQLKTP